MPDTKTTFAVRCLRCGKHTEDDGVTIRVSVETGELNCSDCGEDFTVADIEATLAEWQAVLPWLKSHPANQ